MKVAPHQSLSVHRVYLLVPLNPLECQGSALEVYWVGEYRMKSAKVRKPLVRRLVKPFVLRRLRKLVLKRLGLPTLPLVDFGVEQPQSRDCLNLCAGRKPCLALHLVFPRAAI